MAKFFLKYDFREKYGGKKRTLKNRKQRFKLKKKEETRTIKFLFVNSFIYKI